MQTFLIQQMTNVVPIFLQDALFDIGSNLSKRVVVIALIALGALTALYLAYQYSPYILNNSTFPNADVNVDDDVNDSIQHESEISVDFSYLENEQKIIESIENDWLDDPAQEVQRIKNANLLTFPVKGDQKIIVMGRVLELKKFYRKTHYVFTHGQASQISIVNQVIKECIKTFTPQWHHPLKIPFRLPHTITYSENANDFTKTYDATKSTFVDDGHHSDKLISVDAQFWNENLLESALYFFSNSKNIAFTSDNQLEKLFKSIFSNYLPHESICSMLAKKAVKIAMKRESETKVGVLYAICIPKEIIKDENKNFAYPCHPFGVACRCFSFNGMIKSLENMQNDCPTYCASSFRTQYRILTSRLTEEKNVRSFAVDPLTREKRKFYSDQVKELVEELNLYSHLSNLYEQLDDDPAVIDQIDSLIEIYPQLDRKIINSLSSTVFVDTKRKF